MQIGAPLRRGAVVRLLVVLVIGSRDLDERSPALVKRDHAVRKAYKDERTRVSHAASDTEVQLGPMCRGLAEFSHAKLTNEAFSERYYTNRF